jgi:hypothetical protein
MEDWTHVCGKIRGWFVGRGERLIKLGNSWFSVKSIEVERLIVSFWGRALNEWGGLTALPTLRKLRIQKKDVRQTDPGREGSGSRGKQPRSYVKVLKIDLSDKGAGYTVTTKRWAWRQPSLRECVIAQWFSISTLKMYRDLRSCTEAANLKYIKR